MTFSEDTPIISIYDIKDGSNYTITQKANGTFDCPTIGANTITNSTTPIIYGATVSDYLGGWFFIGWLLHKAEVSVSAQDTDITTSANVVGANTFEYRPGIPLAILSPSTVNRYTDQSSTWAMNSVEFPEFDTSKTTLRDSQPVGYHDIGWGIFPQVYKIGNGWALTEGGTPLRFVSCHGNLETVFIPLSPVPLTIADTTKHLLVISIQVSDSQASSFSSAYITFI
jgi:hypothetical protein